MPPSTIEATLLLLAAAFSALEEQDFFTDIGSEFCISDAVEMVPDGMAYALIHEQDLDNLREDGAFHVAYGSADGSEDTCTEAGRLVQQALITHGLAAYWDGNPGHRIRVVAAP